MLYSVFMSAVTSTIRAAARMATSAATAAALAWQARLHCSFAFLAGFWARQRRACWVWRSRWASGGVLFFPPRILGGRYGRGSSTLRGSGGGGGRLFCIGVDEKEQERG